MAPAATSGTSWPTFALRAGDAQTAQQMFARIGNDWEMDVWKTKALFDASRTGQKIGNTQSLPANGAVAGPGGFG
jgi:hypothetical protein